MTREKSPIKSILFACNMNSIRSPMAEALARKILGRNVRVASCGIYEGGDDPFVPMVMAEDGVDFPEREAFEFKDLNVASFDIVVPLTKEAAEEALKFTSADKIEMWEIPNPTDTYGRREQMMEAYREARDIIKKQINARFSS